MKNKCRRKKCKEERVKVKKLLEEISETRKNKYKLEYHLQLLKRTNPDYENIARIRQKLHELGLNVCYVADQLTKNETQNQNIQI